MNTAATLTLLNKKEMVKSLSVSQRTIDEWGRKRKISCFQISPRFYLYEFAVVLAACRKQYRVGAAS